jgi:multidrug efflux pump subunit AcrB
VEQGILQPVEEAVRGIQGIREISSTANEGSGNVLIELVAGSDRMKVFQDIDQAISRIRTFPDEIEEPEVTLLANQRDVMEIGLYGDTDIWTLRKLAEQLRDRLLNESNITQVELGNVPGYVTHIEIPRRRLREYGLTLGQVAEIIRQSSEDIPAGDVSTTSGEILLRLQERKQYAEEFGNIRIINSEAGANITLADIAEITDGFEEGDLPSQFNRQTSIELSVYRVGEQLPLEIAATVQQVLDEFDQSLPEGIQYRIDSNAARDYRERLGLLTENGILAIVIVLAILTLFLEYKLAFWVMMGMAISFIGAMLVLPLIGISINMISLFGFLVVLGIVVDDAVVVGENIYEYRQRGEGFLKAAVMGARNISRPVIFSILTNIIAFVPLLFLPGRTGKFWGPLPAVVIVVLAFSLLEALFILPAHLGHSSDKDYLGIGRYIVPVQKAFSRRFDQFLQKYYRPFLERCLVYRYITLSAAIALLVMVGSYGLSDHMGIILMPQVAADEIEEAVSLPVSTTPMQAAAVADEITASTLRMFDENDLYRVAEGVKTNVRGQNFIDVEIVMKPPTERDMEAQEVIELWRDEIGQIAGVDQITFEAERGPGGYAQDISVDLGHNDIEVLEEASQAFVKRVEAFENTRDVNDNYNKGKLRYDFKLLPAGRNLGFTPSEVG